MKKILKLILWVFYAVLGLILGLIIFLYTYYNILEKKQIKLDKQLETRSEVITIPSDTTINPVQDEVLNLLPVPQKVNFKGGYFVFPSTFVYSVSDTLKKSVEDFLKILPEIKTRFTGHGENIQFKYKKNLQAQGYTMDIKPPK